MDIQMFFPGFKTKALTLSFDDGIVQDRRLVSLLQKYRLPCTFNINSGLYEAVWTLKYAEDNIQQHIRLSKEETARLYQGFEVAAHSLTHPDLTALSPEEIAAQVLPDLKNLRALGYADAEGLAYPGGTYDQRTADILRDLKVAFARTINATNDFALPEDFLQWHPTCHFMQENIFALAEAFFALPEDAPALFYIWGHSYELDREEGAWERFEAFCQKISGREEIWYASNGEICAYIQGYRKLQLQEGRPVNISGVPLYLNINGQKTVL